MRPVPTIRIDRKRDRAQEKQVPFHCSTVIISFGDYSLMSVFD
jgi:hypothetical protein